MPFLTQGKTNWKYVLILLILSIIAGGSIFYYSKFPVNIYLPIKPQRLEKYSCNSDADCVIRRINCSGCNFDLACINKNYDHCELSPPSGKSCLPPTPSPTWPRSCECVNSKCVPKEIIGETANWKIYENKAFGFSFKYPSDWVITSDKLPKTPRETVAKENLEIANNSVSEVPKLILWVNPLGFGVTPPDIEYELTSTNEGGVKIVARTEIPQSEENLNIDDYIVISAKPIKLGTNTYAFMFQFKKGGKDYEPIFKQILSTFMFIEIKETECEKWNEEISKVPRFEDYPVLEEFKGKPVAVDFSSNSDALRFVTIIIEGAKKGPNFAGHYTIIEWGCGTNCQSGVVVDARTGAIYWLPVSEFGKEFYLNSNLLIVNPPKVIEEIFKDQSIPEWASTRYYKWENNRFELIYQSSKIERCKNQSEGL